MFAKRVATGVVAVSVAVLGGSAIVSAAEQQPPRPPSPAVAGSDAPSPVAEESDASPERVRPLDVLLERSVADGVIDADQAEQMRAIADELVAERRAEHAERGAAREEASADRAQRREGRVGEREQRRDGRPTPAAGRDSQAPHDAPSQPQYSDQAG